MARRIPSPAPATVHPDPPSVAVVDGSGAAVIVDERGSMSAGPAVLRRSGTAPAGVLAWAGPWPADERWWDAASRCRRSRLQVLTEAGTAHLLAFDGDRWLLEATYDSAGHRRVLEQPTDPVVRVRTPALRREASGRTSGRRPGRRGVVASPAAVPPTGRPDRRPPRPGPAAYAELHCHSNFSFLDGASHPEELAEEAARLGLSALALTDHDGLYGVVRFAEAARAVGLPTVFGAELTLELTRAQTGAADPEGAHLIVLARDPDGYARLSRTIARVADVRRREGPPDGKRYLTFRARTTGTG